MGEWYDIGLWAGKKVAEKVDALIKEEHKSESRNFDPEMTRPMPDGSKVYQWCCKWNPGRYPEEKKLVRILRGFDDAYKKELKGEDEEVAHAYKLVAVGDQDGYDEMANSYGYDYFVELYRPSSVHYPEEDGQSYYGPYYDIVLARKPAGGMLCKTEARKMLDMLSGYMVGPAGPFALEGGACLVGFVSSNGTETPRGPGHTQAGAPSLLPCVIASHLQEASDKGPGPWTFDIDGTSVYVSAENGE